MITLKELAAKLDVSISTVSKALNGSSEIGARTANRVKEAAKLHNYRPNRVALSLKNSKTKTIGVIIPDILNHFFAKVLYGIERESAKQGYSIITCLSNNKFKKEAETLELLTNGTVDGFIMSISEETEKNNETEHLQDIIDRKTPILMFDRVSQAVACDKVIIDDFQAAYDATRHLIKEGRKQIVLINSMAELTIGKLRAKGCKQAAIDAAHYNGEVIECIIDNTEDIEVGIEHIFSSNKAIDGIIAIDNLSGVIALNTALRLGYSIPEDLSIIGFADENVLPFTNPKLSTITQNPASIGKASVALMVKRLESKTPLKPVTKTVDFSLNLRGTTL